MSARRSQLAALGAALLVIAATPIASALAEAPARDQYIPTPPTPTGESDLRDDGSGAGGNQSSGSVDDRALARVSGDDKAPGDEDGRQDRGSSDINVPALPAGSGDDDDGDGALASIGSALTDWHDPVVPGSVALVALATLGTAITVLVRRLRDPG